ncbi:MAG: hypothetical protein HY902_11330 [Deltaproteobacteria bacterium]|nr:hypothetical protein [Deltaproteobacteria bacterium]
MIDELNYDPPWGGDWPADGQAIDVPSPAPSAAWVALRQQLQAIGFEAEPNIHPEVGLVGYSLRVRNASVGVGVVQRGAGLQLAVTAVLCRGMDRARLALAAIDRANRDLRLGQMLFYPGPPPELAFYLSLPWEHLRGGLLAPTLTAVLREIEQVGFPAVALVQGYHPGDLEQLFRQLEELAAAQPAPADAEASPPPLAEPPPAPRPTAVRKRKKIKTSDPD